LGSPLVEGSDRHPREADATGSKLNARAALSVLRLPSLSPRIVCSRRCVVQEAKLLPGWLYRSAYECRNLGIGDSVRHPSCMFISSTSRWH
jgi:hypothetical protein